MNKVILADGTELTGFTLNGTMLTFTNGIDKAVFDGKLKTVDVITDTEKLHYNNAYLITWDNQPNDVAFAEKTEMELLKESMQSQLDYIAMMTDVSMEG